MKIKLYFLLFVLSCFAGNLRSQANYGSDQMFSTLHGDIAISINTGDSVLLLVSNELIANLDYETSRLTFRVSYNTFSTGIDSIDTRIRAFADTIMEFTGKISLTINPQKQDPQNYQLDGNLSIAGQPLAVRGKGSITCIPAANRLTPACTLLFTIESKLSDLHLTPIFSTFKDGVRIDLRQSILEKQK